MNKYVDDFLLESTTLLSVLDFLTLGGDPSKEKSF